MNQDPPIPPKPPQDGAIRNPFGAGASPVVNPLRPNIGGVGDEPPGVPPNDEYTRTRRTGGFRLLWILILIAIGFGGYFVWRDVIANREDGEPPVIEVDKAPLKLPPDMAGIDQSDAPNLNVYDILEGEPETSKAPPETKQNNLESLLDGVRKGKAIKSPAPIAAKPAPIAADTPPTAVPPPPPAGAVVQQDYMVQLASLRSRAQARASYTKLQKRHPVLLQSRTPLIIRADLGERGVYYRLNVIGFGVLAEAKDFCAALKEQKQDCLVVKRP